MSPPYTIAEVNAFQRDDFVRVIGPVFERSAWIAEMAWARRPFPTVAALHDALCRSVQEAGLEKQLALIRAHPDLVGRAALAGTLTSESTKEQASAGLDKLSADEIATFKKYNEAYQAKFGFPFVVCARLNKKEAILAGFEKRLQGSRQEEIQAALEEISKIAWLRLRDIVS